MLALLAWFGFAVGGAIDEQLFPNKSPYATGIGGDAIGVIVAVGFGIYLMTQFL